MRDRDLPTAAPTRRALLAGGAIAPMSTRSEQWAPALSAFDVWLRERERLERLLDTMSEDLEEERGELFGQCVAVENLIFNTRSSLTSAVRAKARILSLLMDQENHEWALALRDIRDFIERAA